MEIDVEFTLNQANTVRIDGGYWTYPNSSPRKIPNHGFKVRRRWSGSGESLQDDQEMIYIFHNDDSTYEAILHELQFYLGGDSISLDSLQNWTNWQTIGNYPQWIGPLDSLIVPMDTIPVGKFLYFRSEFEMMSWDASDTATFSDVGYHEEQETRPSAWMGCDALTPIFCRGKDFYFKLGVANHTGLTLSGTLTFTGYANYDCDPIYSLINIRRAKSYSPGLTETYYYFSVPNAVQAGRYSAGVSGSLSDGHGNYYPMSCCMNLDIIQCGPFRTGENTEWGLVEASREEVEAVLPAVSSLAQNYPNPFNEETNINYNLAEAGDVTLKVYDISGRLVGTLVEGYQEAGAHVVTWDASEVSSGVYFYKLTAGDYTLTKKMNLLK